MQHQTTQYPVNVRIEYPERADRLTTFFRIVTVFPVMVVFVLLLGGHVPAESAKETSCVCYGGGMLFLPPLLMILFRHKYPKWWFDWNAQLSRFGMRVFSYLLLLRHEYPSTDNEQQVHVELPYPDVKKELHRVMPLVKWFLAIPHLVVLSFLAVAVVVCTLIAWVAILITGSYPRSMFEFVVGVMRWGFRVSAYAFLLTTDRYPPFSLKE